MIEIVRMSKTHTHTHTHTHTLINITVERVSMEVWMKIFDTPHFFRTIPLPTPPFLWEKSDPRSFWRILRKLSPSLPFIKEGFQLW